MHLFIYYQPIANLYCVNWFGLMYRTVFKTFRTAVTLYTHTNAAVACLERHRAYKVNETHTHTHWTAIVTSIHMKIL